MTIKPFCERMALVFEVLIDSIHRSSFRRDIFKQRWVPFGPGFQTDMRIQLAGSDLIAEDAEAGSSESGRSAGDVLLQRGLEIDDGVGTELTRLFLDDPQESLIIKFFERRPSLVETFVAIG